MLHTGCKSHKYEKVTVNQLRTDVQPSRHKTKTHGHPIEGLTVDGSIHRRTGKQEIHNMKYNVWRQSVELRNSTDVIEGGWSRTRR